MSLLRSSRPLRAVLVALLVLTTLSVGARSASAVGTWSDAVRIPTVVRSQTPPNVEADAANALSCSGPGDCTFGGAYYIQSSAQHAMLATSAGGVWSGGTDPLGLDPDSNLYGASEVRAVSCSAPGECAIGGNFDTVKGFVATKTGGTWQAAQLVTGTIFTYDTDIRVTAISCSASGECVAAGRSNYDDCLNSNPCWVNEAFLMVQTGGVWQSAIRVPGLAGLNTGADSQATSVSCSSPGNCMVGGFYSVMNGAAVEVRPFVASSTNGTWSNAVTIPGITPSNIDDRGPDFPRMKVSVSCPTGANCVIGGAYTGNNTFLYGAYADQTSFVATLSGGTWTPVLVSELLAPGTTPRIDSTVTSVSCATATSCTAAGRYTIGGGRQGFIATLSGGTWTAVPVPGLSALNTGNDATVTSVSCAPNGTCALGGSYKAGSQRHAYVASKSNDVWSDAVAVPALVAMNSGGSAEVTSVSCSSTGDCSATGFYGFGAGKQGVFATRLTAGGDPNSSTTSSTTPTSTSTTIDGSVTPDGATDGSGSSDANGSSDGAADQVAPAFTG